MKWDDFHDIHAGETGLIIGSGQSLRDVPILFLNKYPSFGQNRIYLLEGFTPTYYVAADREITRYVDHIKEIQAKAKFIREGRSQLVPESIPIKIKSYPSFTFDMNKEIWEGWTVTFVSLQIAYWMGFTTVLLVGIDHYYGKNNRAVDWHFIDNYGDGDDDVEAELTRPEEAYHMAKEAYTSNNRRVINLTEGTHLDVFEKGLVSEW